MAVNIKTLTFAKPTFTGSGSSAQITSIPIVVDAFDNDLDNALVTKVFQSFNSGTGAFENITGATLTVGATDKKTNATINFSTAIAATTTILVRLYETDLDTPADTNDTSFVIRDLYTDFTSGDSSEQVPLQLTSTAGNYKVNMSQIDETSSNLNSATFNSAKPPVTATISVLTDYVSILPGTVIKVSITDATDSDSADFTGSIRSSLKIVSA